MAVVTTFKQIQGEWHQRKHNFDGVPLVELEQWLAVVNQTNPKAEVLYRSIKEEIERVIAAIHAKAEQERPHVDSERRHKEKLSLTERAIKASKEANRISEQANQFASRANEISISSARWSRAAVSISGVALVIAGCQAFFSCRSPRDTGESRQSHQTPQSAPITKPPASISNHTTNSTTTTPTNQPPPTLTNQPKRIP